MKISISRSAGIAFVTTLSSSAFAGQMFAVDSSRAVFSIDYSTGAKTQVGTLTANVGTSAGFAYDSATSTLWVTSTGNDSLYTVNMNTWEATLVGAYGDSTLVMHGLEWDSSSGTLYGASNGNLYKISTANGLATQIGVSGLSSFTNLGHNSTTDKMFATNSGTDSFYMVDRTSGSMTLIGTLGAGSTNPNGLAYNPDDEQLYMIDNSADILYTINMTTGAATAIGSTGAGNLLGLVYVPDAIPEPTTMTILGLGALALLRKKRTIG